MITCFGRVVPALALSLMLTACGKSEPPAASQAVAEPDTAAVVAPESVAPAHNTYSAKEFFETTSFVSPASGPYGFHVDNKSFLIGSDETGVFNAWRLDSETGERRQLTTSEGSPIYPLSWFPDGDRFLYYQDGSGDELDHVFVQDGDGKVTDLTPGEKLKAGFMGWERSGSGFFLFSNERDSAAFDVYRYDATDYSRELVFQNDDGLSLGDISSDGRWVVMIREDSNADNNLFLIDLSADDAESVLITEHEGDVSHQVYGFSADNQQLIFGTDENTEFVQAWTYDLASGDTALLVDSEWDVSYTFYSPSGRYQVTGVNADASTAVTVVDQTTGDALDLGKLPPGDLRSVRFNRDESAVAFGLNSDTSPTDMYVMSLATLDPKRLTTALNPSIDGDDLVDGEVVRFKSYDGLEVPGILYRPKTASAEAPVPAVVWVHGGPGGQSRKGYSATRQHLVNHGYAVFAINNRGSSGYGRTFFHLDDRKHGEDDLADVVTSKEFLGGLDWIDGERIGIIGGSYGGYMVAAALAFEPDVFDLGINIFGVTNWVRTLESIPPWWGSFRDGLYAELGDPAVDGERLRRISPLFHAENIVKPLLVVQGANDPRVLQVESDEIVEKVKANNVPVEYVLFDDEGHGFSKRENRITASEAYLAFLETYL
ncbi:MAG: alpha/beta fold hydrolase [Chromatiales bacterium]|jgi:dipeptidyl aminopeptidase/acylaminoacyl peptidase|nr:alpha/beta fold hydrolase [Acidobacteriota bacterium]MDH3895345.1 alpha/beta fold hydrolase [Chromatiales bacterium]MDH3946578.1 alpha/beta fold hydrolase [Chromatiales bacterium]MDH4013565.1 alpha/beta fold hydrolase [Chromatiales bacterium]